ncbi:MAG TPA: hypothetical protein PLP19_09750 [bacterium]|nr:hypothetical protein [bacterium]HPN43761.1 hypothetical protein [bacterium]
MLKKLGQYYALTFYKIFSRFGHRPAAVNIFDQIAKANNILLCLPENLNGSQMELLTLDKFKEIFPNAKISLVYNAASSIDTKLLTKYNVIQYNPLEMSTFGLLPKPVKEIIIKSSFDIAIDLSIAFCFINTSIIWESKACLRIGFNHPLRDELYNFLIRVNPEETRENSYQSLFRYLGATRNVR